MYQNSCYSNSCIYKKKTYVIFNICFSCKCFVFNIIVQFVLIVAVIEKTIVAVNVGLLNVSFLGSFIRFFNCNRQFITYLNSSFLNKTPHTGIYTPSARKRVRNDLFNGSFIWYNFLILQQFTLHRHATF